MNFKIYTLSRAKKLRRYDLKFEVSAMLEQSGFHKRTLGEQVLIDAKSEFDGELLIAGMVVADVSSQPAEAPL